MLIKVQGNTGQVGFLFHRVATKKACMKSNHNPRPGKRCSGRKPNWPYISLVHTYTCLAHAIHIDPSNTLRPCSLSMLHAPPLSTIIPHSIIGASTPPHPKYDYLLLANRNTRIVSFHPYVYLDISRGIFYRAHTLSLDLPPM